MSWLDEQLGAAGIERFEQALEATGSIVESRGSSADRAIHRQVAEMGGIVASWCERLAASPVPASLDHNDLHPWNILGNGDDARFYDWGDSVVAHPFAAMLVPLGFVKRHLDASLDDRTGVANAGKRHTRRVRPAALGIWRQLLGTLIFVEAPRGDLGRPGGHDLRAALVRR